MQNKKLIPLFVIVILLNLIFAVFIFIISCKYIKLKIKEFYHRFIVGFLLTAYIWRVSAIIFLITKGKDSVFNVDDGRSSTLKTLLVYFVVLFHALSGLAYMFRWSSYWILTKADTHMNERYILKRLKILAIAFLAIISISIWIMLVDIFKIRSSPLFLASGTIIFILGGSATTLIIVSNRFLRIWKRQRYIFYQEKHKIVRWYTITIAWCLYLRMFAQILDIVTQKLSPGGDHSSFYSRFNDYLMMICYFIEIIPSFIISYVLWKSYKEKKEQREKKAAPKIKESNIHQYIKAANWSDPDHNLLETEHTSKNKELTDDSNLGKSKTILDSFLTSGIYSDNEFENISHDEIDPLTYY